MGCNIGYDNTGNTSTTCTGNDWDGSAICKIKDCGKMSLENGTLYTPRGTTYGELGFLECEVGFTLQGDRYITCNESGNWSSIPTCILIDCGDPKPMNGSRIIPEGTTYGSVAYISCDNGYVIRGDDVIICQNGGNWSDSSTCLRDCGSYTVLNGKVDFSNGTLLGNTSTVTCNSGYNISGDTVRQCQHSGWDGNVTCDIQDCGDPTPENGTAIMPTGSTYKSTAFLYCDDGYTRYGEPYIHCLEGGSWSDTPTCNKTVTVTEEDKTFNLETTVAFGLLFGLIGLVAATVVGVCIYMKRCKKPDMKTERADEETFRGVTVEGEHFGETEDNNLPSVLFQHPPPNLGASLPPIVTQKHVSIVPPFPKIKPVSRTSSPNIDTDTVATRLSPTNVTHEQPRYEQDETNIPETPDISEPQPQTIASAEDARAFSEYPTNEDNGSVNNENASLENEEILNEDFLANENMHKELEAPDNAVAEENAFLEEETLQSREAGTNNNDRIVNKNVDGDLDEIEHVSRAQTMYLSENETFNDVTAEPTACWEGSTVTNTPDSTKQSAGWVNQGIYNNTKESKSIVGRQCNTTYDTSEEMPDLIPSLCMESKASSVVNGKFLQVTNNPVRSPTPKLNPQSANIASQIVTRMPSVENYTQEDEASPNISNSEPHTLSTDDDFDFSQSDMDNNASFGASGTPKTPVQEPESALRKMSLRSLKTDETDMVTRKSPILVRNARTSIPKRKPSGASTALKTSRHLNTAYGPSEPQPIKEYNPSTVKKVVDKEEKMMIQKMQNDRKRKQKFRMHNILSAYSATKDSNTK